LEQAATADTKAKSGISTNTKVVILERSSRISVFVLQIDRPVRIEPDLHPDLTRFDWRF